MFLSEESDIHVKDSSFDKKDDGCPTVMSSHPMKEHSVASDIQRIHSLILQLEDLIRRIDVNQKKSMETTAEILKECNDLLSEVKIEFHQTLKDADQFEFERIPEIPIDDIKLKKAWLVLYKYHNGATADTIAEDLIRHRTTVSTYLNTLVLMHFAKKERIGHEIMYKAILSKDTEAQ
jgi:predicted transcriptional regulator